MDKKGYVDLMNNTQPELSVIMPTYNENTHALKTCVYSVLQQTYPDFEFLIVVEPEEKNMLFLRDLATSDKRVAIIENEAKKEYLAKSGRIKSYCLLTFM